MRLASQLTGWSIDILTEVEESERRQKEFTERTALFMEALDVDEVIAQLLATEGFTDVEDLAFVEMDEIAAIEGFDEETAEEIQTRAREFLDRQASEQDARRKELGVEDDVLAIEGVTLPMAVKFGENEVFSVDDLAGMTPDDLRGWYETRDGERVREPGILDGFDIDAADAERMIMKARVAAGWISEEDLPVEEPAEDEAEADVQGEDAADAEPAEDGEFDLAALEAEAERLGVDLETLINAGGDSETAEEDETK